MKKLLTICILLLSINAFAQDYKVISNVGALRKNISAVDGSVAYLLGHTTRGDGGGGLYIYSDTSRAQDDGGAIIKTQGLPGAWIHEVQNNNVSLRWWGIRALTATYASTGNYYNLAQDDIYQEYLAAIDFITTRAIGATLTIEAGQGGIWNTGAYYSSQTWRVDKPSITILGTKSPIGNPSTKILWNLRDTCIYVVESAKSFTIDNIELSAVNDSRGWGDSTGHGIYSNSAVYARNLSFLNLAGDAIKLVACAIPNDPNYGNADHSILEDIWVNNTNHGIYMKGCDVNKVSVIRLQASNVRRWCVYDDGFLGSGYDRPHFAYCGTALHNPTTVQYNGKAYITRYQVEDKFVNKGFRPDLHPEIWFEYSTTGYAPEWKPDVRYWSAGTLALINDNAVHNVTDMYTEDGQAPGFLNTRSSLKDGTRGSPTFGGVQKRAMFGTEYSNAKAVYPGILIDEFGTYEFPQAPLHVVQNQSKSGMLDVFKFQSMTDALWGKFSNSLGDAYINVQGPTIKLHSIDGNWMGVDVGGMYVKSLGLSTSKKYMVWDDGKVGYTLNAPGSTNTNGGGVSQAAFDAAIAALQAQVNSQPSGVSQAAFNALLTKVNSLDAILATKASKEEVASVSALLQALTLRVNALPTGGSTPNLQLTQILAELQTIITRLQNELPK